MQLQPAVAAIDRDAFIEVVDGLALHLDQRVVARLQRQAVGHVLIGQDHAAHRVRGRHHAEGAALGRVHQLFERADDGHDVAGELLLVVAEIGLLGDLPPLAQGVQHFVDGRLGLQELRIHLEQVAIGAVEELHALVGSEDHDAGAEALQHVVMGRDVARQLRVRILQRGLVQRIADQRAGRQRRFVEIEQPALAAHHLLLAFRLHHAELLRAGGEGARRAVDVAAGSQRFARRQVEQPVECLVAVGDGERSRRGTRSASAAGRATP